MRRLRPSALGMVLCVMGAGLAVTAVSAAPKPQRIVSLNLCTDQILLELVGRERIAALSYLSQDPHGSALAAQAQGLHTVRGNAEEVLALKPDLVLVGTYTTRHTTAMLRRFGIPVVAIPGANSFEDVAKEMREVAKAVGEEHKAETLIAQFNQRWQAMRASAHTVTTRYTAGGYSAGSNTMYDAIFDAAGHINGAKRAGVVGYKPLPLERLVQQAPQIIVGNDYKPGSPTQANRLLSHPAIRGLQAKAVVLASRDTVCGGPWNLDAAQQLRDAGAS